MLGLGQTGHGFAQMQPIGTDFLSVFIRPICVDLCPIQAF